MATVQVRYMVNDVDAAIAFYCLHLGFKEVMHTAPSFAMLSRGDLRLVLSAPSTNAGGGAILSGCRKPQPGGWNRFAIEVSDISAMAEKLRKAGVQFRSDVIEGAGGKQAIIEDPSGNPVELLQPTRPEARLSDTQSHLMVADNSRNGFAWFMWNSHSSLNASFSPLHAY